MPRPRRSVDEQVSVTFQSDRSDAEQMAALAQLWGINNRSVLYRAAQRLFLRRYSAAATLADTEAPSEVKEAA